MGEHLVGIVGAGQIARLHAQNIAARVPRLRPVAVADPALDAATALAAELGCEPLEDWRELLERPDVDALLLCSPSQLHPEQIAAAAEARKHVFCEKPIAIDLSAADRAVEAAEAAGIVLQIGYNRRFDRSFAAVREAVAGGRDGDSHAFDANGSRIPPEPTEPQLRPLKRGGVLGPHPATIGSSTRMPAPFCACVKPYW